MSKIDRIDIISKVYDRNLIHVVEKIYLLAGEKAYTSSLIVSKNWNAILGKCIGDLKEFLLRARTRGFTSAAQEAYWDQMGWTKNKMQAWDNQMVHKVFAAATDFHDLFNKYD